MSETQQESTHEAVGQAETILRSVAIESAEKGNYSTDIPEEIGDEIDNNLEALYAEHLKAYDATPDRPQPGVLPREIFNKIVANYVTTRSAIQAMAIQQWRKEPGELSMITHFERSMKEYNLQVRRALSGQDVSVTEHAISHATDHSANTSVVRQETAPHLSPQSEEALHKLVEPLTTAVVYGNDGYIASYQAHIKQTGDVGLA